MSAVWSAGLMRLCAEAQRQLRYYNRDILIIPRGLTCTLTRCSKPLMFTRADVVFSLYVLHSRVI